MSRDLDLLPKALPKVWFVGIESHLQHLSAQGSAVDQLDIESNPHAVRLVAAGINESAYEYTNQAGGRNGVLTESFMLAMKEARGLEVSWLDLGTRIRERVLSLFPLQHPEIEGPANRLLFELHTVLRTGVLPVVRREDRFVLPGGRLMGVNPGDRYTILPMGSEKPGEADQIAVAKVSSSSGSFADLDIQYEPGRHTIPEGAKAFPLSTVLPKQAVKVQDTGEKADQVRAAITAAERLRMAGDGETEVTGPGELAEGKTDLRDRSDTYSLIEPKPSARPPSVIRLRT
jgi:hypothetical protein